MQNLCTRKEFLDWPISRRVGFPIEMAKAVGRDIKERRRQLVDQIASSPYFSKSARLRDMFIYVCDRVLDHDVDEIHEQEVGRRVFGRPADYDTSADNTVRVHASMLRKRVDQYFANEGLSEPVIIEIPRGNYAPVFHERAVKLAPPEPEQVLAPQPVETAPPEPPRTAVEPKRDWKLWFPTALAVLFAAVSVFLFVQLRSLQAARPLASEPTVRKFWSQIFQPKRTTDLVLGDATLSLFEEQTGHQVALSEYFDRSYLNMAATWATGTQLNPELGKMLLLRRQTNYGDVALLAQITDTAHSEQSDTKFRFAREYSFREIKADNAVLLGNLASNPWVEPFQNRQSLRWKYDATRGTYYPVDNTAASQEKYHTTQSGQPAEGYASVSLFPNMDGTGNVLIISGTGGTAMSGALSFLFDEHAMSQLGAQLNIAPNAPFPYFEALLRIGSRNTLPRDSGILIVRPLHK